MQLDSHRIEGKTDKPVLDESRSDWVDVQLSRTFMANARTALFSAFVGILVTTLMLYGSVSTPHLMAWTAAVLGLAFYREWIVKTYRSRYTHASARELNAFLDLHRFSWPLSSVLWAALMFLYLDKVPLVNQFICILILAGMGVFSVMLMSARLDCFVPYIYALSLTSLSAVLVSWLKDGVWSVAPFDVAMIALIGIFGVVLVISGKRFHAVQRRGFELQYDNEQLIASLREQTKTAMQAVTVKNGLLANAAHDLRQPVHALAFYADWLRNEPDLAALVVPKILLATDSVNTLFNSLFDFAKIEAGAVKPKFSKVPVGEIVEDLMLQFRPAAFSKNIIFRQRITPGYVWTDPVLVRRIVGNLLGNAVRYTQRGGVLLSTRRRQGCMWIEVWDTGVGIAPEHQEQVFQEFYKASQHSGTEDGFGLGLAIVKRLSQVLGHKVSMTSHVGKGTCMRIEIALANSDGTGPVKL
jgi:signal transduction histidine kinase